jgi:dihydrofolate synthase / folylpolyglutamate synthase
MGGRLDATNVVQNPKVTVITCIGPDHQQYLGETVEEIAWEKAGILKRGCIGVLAANAPEVREVVESVAEKVGAPLKISGQEWQSYAEHGRMVYQDENGLMDLPMPALIGPHQIDNAGSAIAAIRALNDPRITEDAIALGLARVKWPARMQKLGAGHLWEFVSPETELWLDGAHNGPAGLVVAQTMREMAKRSPKPLVLILGMLNTKNPAALIAPFKGLAEQVITLAIPDEANAISADELAQLAKAQGLAAMPATSLQKALEQACLMHPAPRILICGSLYLAGYVLALHSGEEASKVSGAAKR